MKPLIWAFIEPKYPYKVIQVMLGSDTALYSVKYIPTLFPF